MMTTGKRNFIAVSVGAGIGARDAFGSLHQTGAPAKVPVSPRSGRGGVATIRRALCAKFAALRDNFQRSGFQPEARTGASGTIAFHAPAPVRRPAPDPTPPTAGTHDKTMALNLFRRLMPPEKSFTALFREQADCMVDAAEELRDMVGQREVAVEAHIASIRTIETKSDAVVRQIFLSANRTFNAPIDREDILTLAHELDDVVDLIEDTAKGIQRYAMSEFPAEMQTMVNAVVESAE